MVAVVPIFVYKPAGSCSGIAVYKIILFDELGLH